MVSGGEPGGSARRGGAVVPLTVQGCHLQVGGEKLYPRFEQVVEHGVRQKFVRGVVRRRHEHDPALDHLPEQPRDKRCVSGTVDMELVKAQQPGIPQQCVQPGGKRGLLRKVFPAVSRKSPGMQFAEEIVEVQAPLLGQRNGLIEGVQEPGFSASGRTPQIQGAAGGRPTSGDGGGACAGQMWKHRQLGVVELNSLFCRGANQRVSQDLNRHGGHRTVIPGPTSHSKTVHLRSVTSAGSLPPTRETEREMLFPIGGVIWGNRAGVAESRE